MAFDKVKHLRANIELAELKISILQAGFEYQAVDEQFRRTAEIKNVNVILKGLKQELKALGHDN